MSSAAQDEVNALFRQQQNTCTTHPEDATAASDTSESSSDNDLTLRSTDDDDDDTLASTRSTAMPSATYHIPSSTTFDANTGPKGVIADAKSFDKAKKRSFRQTLLAFSTAHAPSSFSSNRSKESRSLREKSLSPDPSTDDDEDEFMQKWRASRLNELQEHGHDRRTRRLSPSKRRYGRLDIVDPIGYLDAIEKVPADTMVVVCIYDDESSISGIVEDALSSLARKHETTRFVKLHYLDAEMDETSVPAILAYKGGDLFANLVSVIDEIPAGRDLSVSSLESVLQSYKVLN
ncbi:hypothetical protein MMC20_003298 [Loxospora ochrophaea]|nr:hypothetical protein [Loxospora ochrophaea]